MSICPATAEFLSALCRLLDLLSNPEDIPFLSGLLEREIIYRILRGPEGATVTSNRDIGRPEPPHRQSNYMDQGKLRETASR